MDEEKQNGESEPEPEMPQWLQEEPPKMPTPIVVERRTGETK
jgi:hypothetical protein